MSPIRLLIAVALAIAIVGAVILASAILGVPSLSVLGALAALSGVSLTVYVYWVLRPAMRKFSLRPCTGHHWKKNFPNSSSDQIRQFLGLVIAELSLPIQPLQLHPNDRILDLYHAIYPIEAMPDGCELESLVQSFKRIYGHDLLPFWRDDLTLRDIYAYAIAP